MNVLKSYVALAVLVALNAAAPCVYNGITYEDFGKFPHANECAQLQCQFGKATLFYEACGKEIDGKCNNKNNMFVYQGDTYQCIRVDQGSTVEFKYVIVYAKNRDCVVDGKTYQHLAKLRLKGSCQDYQCQNATLVSLDKGCETNTDNKCPVPGEIFVKDGKTFECQTKSDGSGYQAKQITPSAGTRACTAAGKTFSHLEVFTIPGNCNKRQCNDKAIKIITSACTFKGSEETCYSFGEKWTYNGKDYECASTGTGVVKPILNQSGVYKQCLRNEQKYDHLDVHTHADGCSAVQCQNGQTPPVKEACYSSSEGKCYDLNFVWKSGNTIRKCILNEEKLYRIVVVDENGKIIDVPVPTMAPPEPVETCPELAADILFIWDASGSIARRDFARQLNFSCDIISFFDVGPKNVQVGGVVFSDNAEKVFDLNTYKDFPSICKAITSVPFLGLGTQTQKAFEVIVSEGMLTGAAGGRLKVPNIIIVITDGKSDDMDKTIAAAGQAKALGAEVISIGVGAISLEELIGIASRKENVFTITNYDAIFSLRKDLANLTCHIPPDPIVPPEPEPPKCPGSVADIIFLIDSSSEVGDNNYKTELNLADSLAGIYAISPKNVQIGAVLFGSQPKTLFDLNTFSNKDDVSKAIKAAPYLKGDRELDDAIDLVLTNGLFTAAHRGRDNAARVAFILLTGSPTDWTKTLPLAKKLRNEGVRVITIGVGDFPQKKVTGLSGKQETTFTAESYQLLAFVKAKLFDVACDASKQPRPDVEPPRCTDTEVPPCDQVCTDTDTGFTCSCKTGYLKNTRDNKKCDDINECITQNDLCEHSCENTLGSYECACRPGYVIKADDKSKCTDINECNSKPCQDTCTNTLGSYHCNCPDGYQVSAKNPNLCEDINECSNNSPCQQICNNKDGGYSCSCKPGYVVSRSDPDKCEDIDECAINSPCQHICDNNDGGYTCSCKPGFEVSKTDPNKCTDINECSRSFPCQQECTNKDGGYTCSCKPGYVINPKFPDKCDEVDKCGTKSPCDQICQNVGGGFKCSCRFGYQISPSNPNKCDDVDECAKNSPCQQLCKNTLGGYTCSCKPGYEISTTDPNKCVDVDECSKFSPCEQQCTNSDGSYTCSCRPGYVVSAKDKNKCDDVDECAKGSPCQQQCDNRAGGYTCSCRAGYVISPTDPNKCDDIDECVKDVPCQQICTNTDGKYICSCQPGFVISKRDPNKCDELDPCESSPCEHICNKTTGGYTCSCKAGYKVSPQDSTRCVEKEKPCPKPSGVCRCEDETAVFILPDCNCPTRSRHIPYHQMKPKVVTSCGN